MALTGLEQQGFSVSLGDVAALSSFELPIINPQRTIKITRAAITGSCDVTAHATNYFEARLRRSATETICSIDTATTGLTAKTFRDFSTPAAAVAEVASCHHMYLEVTPRGSGAALVRATLLVNYEVIGN
jgi:hypothetical protein